jgi:K+-sensing histidine kinase KdpD
MDPETRTEGSVAIALGPLAAVSVAGLLAPVRDNVGATNVALILAMIVVLAGVAGRMAGVLTALVAAVGYNFFHTEPYHSLRISSTKDVVTVLLLAALGLVVGEVSAWRRRAQRKSRRHLQSARALETTSAMLAAGSEVDEIWTTIRDALMSELDLADCRFEPGTTTEMPLLRRSGALVAPSMHLAKDGFTLPDQGVAIAVIAADRTLGHIILLPRAGSGSSLERRRVAVALADQYAVALTMHQHLTS